METLQHTPGTRHLRGRAALAATVTAATLALPASALAANFSVVGHFPNHTPIVGKNWVAVVDVTKGNTKLSGSVTYQFLIGTTVVSTNKETGSPYKFKNGVWKHTLIFPAESADNQLTLKVIVTTKYGTKSIHWEVEAKQS